MSRPEELASGSPGGSQMKPAMRISNSPSSSILNERHRKSSRPSNSSGLLQADNQSNITIIDCRRPDDQTQAAHADPLKLLHESLQGGVSAAAASSEKPGRKSTFDQFKSSLGLGERRRRRPEPQRSQPLVEIPPANVKILDIRRRKTNRKRPKQFQRLSNEYENVAPQCQLARDEDDDEEGDDEEADNGLVGQEAYDSAEPNGDSMDQSGGQSRQADAIRNKKQQQQQQQQQQQEKQRQQSGETLSSFESDYDLLVYLGETETEDLVETERSLDYLDQTWRQSICGGSSLAPTLDESLGELLQTPQNRFATTPRSPLEHNDEFEQLWTMPSGPNARQSRPAQQVAALTTANTLNPNSRQPHQRATSNRLAAPRDDRQGDLLSDLSYGWSASLPRQTSQRLVEPLERTQTEVKSLGRRTNSNNSSSNNNDLELAQSSRSSSSNRVSKQVAANVANSQRPAGNLGNKLVSLFGRNPATTTPSEPSKQRQVPAGLSEREAETVRQLNEFLEQARLSPAQMEAPQKPRRHQQQQQQQVAVAGPGTRGQESKADELDRLLAEMSQSLDLDSLARYDPYSRQVHRGRKFEPNDAGQRRPPGGTSLVSKTNATREANKVQNEAILNEYDGASRILEQMINDQLLVEAADSRREPQQQQVVRDGQQRQQATSKRLVESKRVSSSQSPNRINEHSARTSSGEPQLTSNEDHNSGSSSLVRKISSTSTGTTETSVVPAASRGRSMKPADERRRSSSGSRNRAPHLNRIGQKLSIFSRSLDVDPEAKRVPPEPLVAPMSSNLLANNVEAPDEGDDEDEDEREVPPRPPAVDYHDFEETERDEIRGRTKDNSTKGSLEGRALIQVEASELPFPTSSESEHEDDRERGRRPSWSKRQKLAMNRVKQRTMSGVRSVRQHFNKRPQDEANKPPGGGVALPDRILELQPEPPARARSTGSSSNRSASSQNRNPLEVAPIEATTVTSNVVAAAAAAAESPPRQSRQRTRRAPATDDTKPEPPVEDDGAKKSFGRQMRERLSRSKSRLSKLLRPLSLHRSSQAAPAGEDNQQEAAAAAKQREPPVLLFQPGDIARNEPPARDESSLERQLKADLYDGTRGETGGRLMAQKSSPSSSRGRSRDSEKSQASGDLSGLETVDKKKEGLLEMALGRKLSATRQRVTRRQQTRQAGKQDERRRRPVSLMSLKRFGDAFGRGNRSEPEEKAETQDLDQQMATAAAVAHRKRNKRTRNRSTGDQRNESPSDPTSQSVVQSRVTTTDDYFGFRAPPKTSPIGGERGRHSAEVHQRVEVGPRVRPASAMMFDPDDDDDDDELDTDQARRPPKQQHQRFFARRNRRIPNRSQSLRGSDFEATRAGSKRPEVKRAPNDEAQDQGQESQQTKSVSFQNLAPPALGPNQRRPLSPVSPNTFRPISTTPGASGADERQPVETSRRPELDSITPIPVVSPVMANNHPTSVSATPPRARPTSKSHTLLQDLRNKCSDLFAPDHKQRPQAPPVRPPRSRRRQTLASERSKSLAAPRARLHTDEEPSSEPRKSLLTASASPELRHGTLSSSSTAAVQPRRAAVGKRLTNFAHQLRTSAADFFAGGGGGQFKRQASDLGPASRRVAQTTTSAEKRPHFWNLDEPADEQRDLAQWRPIIPVGDHHSKAGGSSKDKDAAQRGARARRSGSLRAPKADDHDHDDHQRRSRTLAGEEATVGSSHLGARTGHNPYDSDSTWDSSCSEAEPEETGGEPRRIVQAMGAQDPSRIVHGDESSRGKQQVTSPSMDRNSGGGGGGGADSQRPPSDIQIKADSSSRPSPSSSLNRRHDKNKDRDRNNNHNNHNCSNQNVTQSDNALASSHISKQLQPEAANKVISSKNSSEHLEEVGGAALGRSGSLLVVPSGDGSRETNNENKTQDRSNLSELSPDGHLFEGEASRERFVAPETVCSVNERAFKFNESLPSPSQILSEVKREGGGGDVERPESDLATRMTATRSARRLHAQVDGNGGVSSTKPPHPNPSLNQQHRQQADANEENANRLSVYENVGPGETRVAAPDDDLELASSQIRGDKPEPAPKPRPQAVERRPPMSLAAPQLVEDDEDDSGSLDDWAVEPVGGQMPKVGISGDLKAKAKAKSSPDKIQEFETILRPANLKAPTSETTKSSESSLNANNQADAIQVEKELTPMTSAKLEQEDAARNSKTGQRQNEKPSELLRRQSTFSLSQLNGNSDDDESESSLLLGNSRLRLERRLAMQREQMAKRNAGAKPPVPSRPPNLPHGRESLVRRMAKNFDQTARDHQQPQAVASRQAQFGPPGARRPNAVAFVQPDPVDEPKSDSTWYDAKSVELLDEAEVAELLREFESEGDNNNQCDEEENSDQFVTLSHDQPGRRDARRRERPGEGDDDEDDDATLNDDETLNDADDAEDPFEVSNNENNEEESVYVSAATGITNENVSPAAAAAVPTGGRVGRLVEEFQRQQQQQQQQQQASARSEAVGRLGAGCCERREAFASLLEGRGDRRRCSSDAAAGADHDDDDDDEARRGGPASRACDVGCERKACASKREQRVESHTRDTTTKHRTNAIADNQQILTPPATTRPVDERQPPPPPESTYPPEANAISVTRDDHDRDRDRLESSSMGATCQMEAKPRRNLSELQDDVNDDEDDDVDDKGDDELQADCDDQTGGPNLFPGDLIGKAELVHVSSQDDEDDSNGAQQSNVDLSSGHSSGGCHEDLISLSSSSLSSESMPELRQRKNLQRLYNIVNEICSSEETFLATLKLLNEDFKRHILKSLPSTSSQTQAQIQASESMSNADILATLQQQPPFDCIALIMKHLPQLQALNENLLDELRQARNQWPSTQKISHVLVKIGPFLKHYSSYIRDFECIQQQFQENLKRSQQFRDAIRRFECEHADKFNQLSIQHHLLKPIQRIPQYRLLLQQYLHHLKPDDADYEDTVEALEVVSRVAEHANQSLSEGANFARLLSLQAKIVAGKQRDLIQPGRLFLKEGELLKVCRKQIQPRWFVLLSDALLYLKVIQLNDILYLKYELPLEDCQVELPEGRHETGPERRPSAAGHERRDGLHYDTKPATGKRAPNLTGSNEDELLARECELNICTTVRSMTLIARNRQERDEWFQALRSAIEQHKAKRRSFRQSGGQQRQDSTELEEPLDGLIGRKAPIWTPDSRVNTCQLCTSNFSALFRRHHCRACGRVVCSACSSNKAPLIYLKCRAARVCDQCFETLRANMHLYYLPSSHIDERELRRLDEHFKTLLKSQFVKRRMFASVASSKVSVPKVVLLKGKAASCAAADKKT